MHVPPDPASRARHPDRTRAAARQVVPRRRLLLLAALLPLAFQSTAARALDPGELTIETPRSAYRFTIELADTPAARSRGLMFRESMPPDHGMLFDFQAEQPVAFWMKNTPMALDMLFIDGKGIIVRIAADTVPFSETPVPSGQPIRAVLEVRAGTAARLGITPGARVRHPIFAAS